MRSKIFDEEMDNRMHNWANWCRSEEDFQKLWYPHTSPMFKGYQAAYRESSKNTPQHRESVINADAIIIEEAVHILRELKPLLYNILRSRWIHRGSGKDLAAQFHRNKNIIFELINEAETILIGIIIAKKF